MDQCVAYSLSMLLACPWHNTEPGTHPVTQGGSLPKVRCWPCALGEASADTSDLEAYFEGNVTFGPVVVDSIVSEAYVREYKVYIVDEFRRKLGGAVATVPASGFVNPLCCQADAYIAYVSAVLPRDFKAFMVVPVTINGLELPAGPTTSDIPDDTSGGLYVPSGLPLKDFSLLLSFSEAVQAGAGNVKVRSNTGVKATIECESGLDILPRHVVLPIRNVLDPAQLHRVELPAGCFRDQDGEVLAAVPVKHDYSFITIDAGKDILEHDHRGPASLGVAALSPPDGSWVQSRGGFTLYFDEAVQRGFMPVTILQTPALGNSASLYDADSTVTFDPGIPGKATVQPNKPLAPGAEYEIAFAAGAFKDLAGNFAASSRTVLGLPGGYRVRVPAAEPGPLDFAAHPRPGASRGVVRHSAILLQFAAPVRPGRGEVELCGDWLPTDVCALRETIPASRTFFLGDKVLLYPESIRPGQHYNVSIPSTAIQHFPGLWASSTGRWPYGFAVDPVERADRSPPVLVAAKADCNGDGDLDDECDTDGDDVADFVEQTGIVSSAIALPHTSTLRLYFQEAVTAAPGLSASLQADDGAAASDVAVGVSSASEPEACVAVLAPPLQQGWLYNLSVPPGLLQDLAEPPNPFGGLSLVFSTVLEPPTVELAGEGLTNVAKDTVIRLAFQGTPRLGFFTDKYVSITDSSAGSHERQIPITDPDRVVFRASDVLVIPQPPLLGGRVYTVFLPKHAVRYMNQDFTFSFSTRMEDTAKPVVLLTYPRGTTSHAALDGAALRVLFSKPVGPSASKSIYIREDGVLKYTMISDDMSCGHGGAAADACAVLDAGNRSLTVYPAGLHRGGTATWATPNRTYAVEIEAGAYTDEPTAGTALANSLERTSFFFKVTEETTRPALLSSTLVKESGVVQTPEGSFDIDFRHDSGRRLQPGLVELGAASPEQPTPVTADGALFLLVFNVPVQAGTGSLGVYQVNLTSGDFLVGSEVPVADLAFSENHAFVSPTVDLAGLEGTHYVMASSADAFRNIYGAAMVQAMDTRANGAPVEPIPTAVVNLGNDSAAPQEEDTAAPPQEEDTVAPEVDYYETKSSTSGRVTLFFSEAVQFVNSSQVLVVNEDVEREIAALAELSGDEALQSANSSNSSQVPVVDEGTQLQEIPALAEISGNQATITLPSTPGATYSLGPAPASFADLSGNVGQATLLSLPSFTIDPDVEGPTVSLRTSGRADGVDAHTALVLEFSEAVQVGSGRLSVRPGPSEHGCGAVCAGSTPAMVFEADVASLPTVSFAAMDGKRRSSVHVDPGVALLPGVQYSLSLPTAAYADIAGNTLQGQPGNRTFEVRASLLRDTTAPRLLLADLGGELPHPAFAGDSFVMYFTEAVQVAAASGASLRLAPSSGGRRCSGAGTCRPPANCTEECGYTPAQSGLEIPDAQLNLSGARVTVHGLGVLEPGRGYKLVVEQGKFADLAGHAAAAVDGENSAAAMVFRAAGRQADVAGPLLLHTKPADGRRMLPPSTTIQLLFNEEVQSGAGVVELVPIDERSDASLIAIPAASCHFQGNAMTCKPPDGLDRITSYAVTYTDDAVMDSVGNIAPSALGNSTSRSLVFTVIDADFLAPVLLEVSGASGPLARARHPRRPYAELSAAGLSAGGYVPAGSALTLSFSEVVQAGTGSVVLADCSPGIATVCYDGVTELQPDHELRMDVRSNSSLFFDGSRVHVELVGTRPGGLYALSADGPGVFVDLAGWPSAALGRGVELRTFARDARAPALLGQVPFSRTAAGAHAPVNANLTLYFSEAVQATGDEVTVAEGSFVTVIPLDNSDPLRGTVTVRGAVVTVDPYEDFGYNSTVTVQMANGSFSDLAGKPAPGLANESFRFHTPELRFKVLWRHQTWAQGRPSPREGPVVHFINDTLLLFGGKNGSRCFNDTWTSLTGSEWEQVKGVESKNHFQPVPTAANAPSAVDRWGCLWLLSGECSTDPGTIWKTCDVGRSWRPLPRASVVPFGREVPPRLPAKWSGHAIALLGGWQLVIVDAADAQKGAVWRFWDADVKLVQRVARAPFPFGARRDPSLLATSDGVLYLVGGHECSGGPRHLCSEVFTDVWGSTDGGETWTCRTSNFVPSLWSEHSRGLGRYTAAVLAHDDTIFLLGGHRPNTTEGSSEVFSSYGGPLDLNFTAPGLHFFLPSQARIFGRMNFSLYFTEDIAVNTSAVRLLDHGLDASDVLAAAAPFDARVTVSRQVLTVSPHGVLTPGHRYSIEVPEGSVMDTAGNVPENVDSRYEVLADPDVEPPAVSAVFPPGGSADVAPWTTVTLHMSEPVVKGAGALRLACAWGRQLALDVEGTTILGAKVLFQLPEGSRLTAGQNYTVTVPTGLFKDIVGNENVAASVGTFTVLSGLQPFHSYLGLNGSGLPQDLLSAVPPLPPEARVGVWRNESSWMDENGTEAPDPQNNAPLELVAVYPPPSATDVPAVAGVAVLLLFTRPVEVDSFLSITFRNATATLGVMSASHDGADSASHVDTFPMHSAARIIIPEAKETGVLLLQKGGITLMDFPRGLFRDADGQQLEAFSVSFACLAEELDTSPPVVTLLKPEFGERDVLGTTTQIELFFSEDVEPGPGSVTLRHLEGEAPSVSLRVGDAPGPEGEAAVVAGPRLTLRLPAGALSAGGLYSLQLTPGALTDRARRLPGGRAESRGSDFEGLTVSFETLRDVEGPRLELAAQHPPPEDEPSFGLPSSASLLLTFSEAVQSGSGAVTLTPRYSRVHVSLPAAAATISGSEAFLSPPGGLLPGEVYSVSIDAAAFLDLQMNAFEGLAGGAYTISFAPRMSFRSLGQGHWADPSRNLTGQRFASGVAVSPTNDILVIGGRNATPGAPADAVLNDVWRFTTVREVSCASAILEPTNCTAQECEPDGLGGHTLGMSTFNRMVWKRRSVGGASCMTPGGRQIGAPGRLVSSREEACPCPTCTRPPGPPEGPALPEGMPNTSYLGAYVLASAANETRPLLCRSGFEPSGAFVCVGHSRHSGRFATPYPVCLTAACAAPPNASGVEGFLAFNASRSTNGIDCRTLGTAVRIEHGGHCGMTCSAGWWYVGRFRCERGTFLAGKCERQECQAVGVQNGRVACPADSEPLLGTTCEVVCDPGYSPEVPSISCAATAAVPEAPPAFSPRPRCVPGVCGKFVHTTGARIDYLPNSTKSIGDTATVTCEEDFAANGESFDLRCGPRQGAVWNAGVEWQLESTGTRAGILCAKNGTEVEERIVLQGRLELVMAPPPGSTLQRVCGDAGFIASVSISIALGLATISEAQVLTSDVHDVAVSACGRRRLQEGETELSYSVFVADEELAATFKTLLTSPASKGRFEHLFAQALEQSAGVTVSNVTAFPLEVLLTYVTVEPTPPPGTTTPLPEPEEEAPAGEGPPGDAGEDGGQLVQALLISLGCILGVAICCVLGGIYVHKRRRRYATGVFPSEGPSSIAHLDAPAAGPPADGGSSTSIVKLEDDPADLRAAGASVD